MLHRVIRKLSPAGVDYQSVVFFMLDLQNSFHTLSPDTALPEIHVIDSTDDPWLSELCDRYPEKRFHLRMIFGDQQCYVVIREGQLCAWAWVTVSPCFVSEIEFLLPVGKASVYIYDCFVQPECRGKGLYQALLRQIIIDYRRPRWSRRFRTACICAEPGNTASIRGICSAGFHAFARARFLQVGRFTRWYGIDGLRERMARFSE